MMLLANLFIILMLVLSVYFFFKRPWVYLSVMAVCTIPAFMFMVGMSAFGYELSWTNFWLWYIVVYFCENVRAALGRKHSFTLLFKELNGMHLESQRKYAEQQRRNGQV